MATLKFRQEALEQATSTEQLGQLIGIVSNKDWAILATLGFLLFTFVLWSIFGSIATRVTGQGILLADNAGIYDAVASFGSAHVINIKIKPGDQVVKGDV